MILTLLLRTSGLVFCLMHAGSVLSAIALARLSLLMGPLEMISTILDASLFLPLGVLLLVVALRLDLLLPRLAGSIPWPRAPRLLATSRMLIAALAGLYLLLIPAQIQGAFALRGSGFALHQQAVARQEAQIRAIKALKASPGSIREAQLQIQRLAQETGVELTILPESAAQIEPITARLQARLKQNLAEKLRLADSDLVIKSIKYTLLALGYGLLLIIATLAWPGRDDYQRRDSAERVAQSASSP